MKREVVSCLSCFAVILFSGCALAHAALTLVDTHAVCVGNPVLLFVSLSRYLYGELCVFSSVHMWPSVPGRPSRADSDPVLGRLLPHRGLCCHLRAPLPGTASTPKGASAKTQGWRVSHMNALHVYPCETFPANTSVTVSDSSVPLIDVLFLNKVIRYHPIFPSSIKQNASILLQQMIL